MLFYASLALGGGGEGMEKIFFKTCEFDDIADHDSDFK